MRLSNVSGTTAIGSGDSRRRCCYLTGVCQGKLHKVVVFISHAAAIILTAIWWVNLTDGSMAGIFSVGLITEFT